MGMFVDRQNPESSGVWALWFRSPYPDYIVVPPTAEAVSSALSITYTAEGAFAEVKGEADFSDACGTLGDGDFPELDHSPASWDGSHHGGELTAHKALAAVDRSLAGGLVGIHMDPSAQGTHRPLGATKGLWRGERAVSDSDVSPDAACRRLEGTMTALCHGYSVKRL